VIGLTVVEVVEVLFGVAGSSVAEETWAVFVIVPA